MERPSKRCCVSKGIEDLPIEILRYLFLKYLEPEDVLRAERVSKSWNHICARDNFAWHFWKNAFDRNCWSLKRRDYDFVADWKQTYRKIWAEVQRTRNLLAILELRSECKTPRNSPRLSEIDIKSAEAQLFTSKVWPGCECPPQADQNIHTFHSCTAQLIQGKLDPSLRFSPSFREYLREYGVYGLEFFDNSKEEVIYFKSLEIMMLGRIPLHSKKVEIPPLLSGGLAYFLCDGRCEAIRLSFDTESESFGYCFDGNGKQISFLELLELLVRYFEYKDSCMIEGVPEEETIFTFKQR